MEYNMEYSECKFFAIYYKCKGSAKIETKSYFKNLIDSIPLMPTLTNTQLINWKNMPKAITIIKISIYM